jgi:hypothetical protein
MLTFRDRLSGFAGLEYLDLVKVDLPFYSGSHMHVRSRMLK